MADVERQINEYPDGFFVAEIGGKVAGYLIVRVAPTPHCVPARNPLQVWRLYVAADHHRQGVARQLMGKAFLHAHSGGHEVVWLGLSKEKTNAIAFY
jgi:ribosomal protein S18 acetylase RimI-like enzyme